MATMKGKFIRGKAGSLVYRELLGQQIIQGLPRVSKGKRTEGTKNSATLFGKASKLAGGLRWGLGYICGKFYDGTMIYRLNTEILRCLTAVKDPGTPYFKFTADTFRTLAGFEFNAKSMVKNYFYVQPSVTISGNTLQVTIPEIKIPVELKWPIDRPKSCKLMIVTSIIDLKKGSTNFGNPQVMEIPYTYTPSIVASQNFEFEMVPGCLHITGITLQYIENTFIGDTTVNTKFFNPAAILHAHIADGTSDENPATAWRTFEDNGYIQSQ